MIEKKEDGPFTNYEDQNAPKENVVNKIVIGKYFKHYCRYNSKVGAAVFFLILLFVLTVPYIQALPLVKDNVGYLRWLVLIMACSFGATAGIRSFLPSFLGLIMTLAAAIVFGEATAMVFLIPVGMFSLPASVFGYFFDKFDEQAQVINCTPTRSSDLIKS